MARLFEQYPDQKYVQGVPKQVDLTEYAKTAGSVLPGIGDAISAYDTYKSFKEGNYGESVLNAVGVLPFIPSLGGVTKVWQHQGSKMNALESRPMWFSSEGSDFFTPFATTTETGLPLVGKMKGELNFSKPLIESKTTKDSWNDLMQESKKFGATQDEVDTITKDWIKNGEFSTYIPEWFQKALKSKGYDGVISDTSFKTEHAIALDPTKTFKVTETGGLLPESSSTSPFYNDPFGDTTK